MAGLGKQLRGSGIARINKAAGGEVESEDDIDPHFTAKVPEDYKDLDPHFTIKSPNDDRDIDPHFTIKNPKRSDILKSLEDSGDKLKKRLKDNIKFVTPSGPDLSDIKKTLGLKKGGSAKRGLWANINRRKKLGISRPKSKSTISKKAYANMKVGFPKKK